MKNKQSQAKEIVLKVLSMYKNKEYWEDLYYDKSPNIDKMAAEIADLIDSEDSINPPRKRLLHLTPQTFNKWL